jgi:hypothetical protein
MTYIMETNNYTDNRQADMPYALSKLIPGSQATMQVRSHPLINCTEEKHEERHCLIDYIGGE